MRDPLNQYGIDESSLDSRRDFIGLGAKEVACLLEHTKWIEGVVEGLVKAFYDYQFAFAPTLKVFERLAQEKGVSLKALRAGLEKAQQQYLIDIFSGAKEQWGGAYFAKRMKVGWVHDQINLPMKWYIGSYSKFQELIRAQLIEDFEVSETMLELEGAIHKVFNYDLQAIVDAFNLSSLNSMGLSTDHIEVDDGEDVTEHFAQIKGAMSTLIKQAEAIASDELEAPILKEKVPGKLGESFTKMSESLLDMVEQLKALSQGSFSSGWDTIPSSGTIGSSLDLLEETLGGMIDTANDILQGTREGDFSKRFSSQNYQGQFLVLSSGINEMLDLTIGLLSFNSKILTSSSQKLKGMASDILSQSVEISTSSSESAERVQDLNFRVQSLSEGMSQMTEAIGEISKSAATVSERADEASDKASSAKDMVVRLQQSGVKIGDMIKTIHGIAQQTNLLALNATIEAARAGDSGKGFAVVANEVKELSKETREASELITSMVTEIQSGTGSAVDAISDIGEMNGHLKEISGSIASAVEEQSVVTQETTRHLERIAEENEHMVVKINDVVEKSEESKAKSEELSGMALQQDGTASELNKVIGGGCGDFIKWGPEYSVGIKSIDDQHKVLFNYVNELFVGVSEMKQDVIEKVLGELVSYTVSHFSYEEDIFKKIGYPQTKEHLEQHEKLVGQVSAFVDEFKSGESVVDFRLLNFLRNWLKGHIQSEDMAYAPDFIRAGIR